MGQKLLRVGSTAKLVHVALQTRAEGCVTAIPVRELARGLRISLRSVFRSTVILERVGQVQRLGQVGGDETQNYHLISMCLSPVTCGKALWIKNRHISYLKSVRSGRGDKLSSIQETGDRFLSTGSTESERLERCDLCRGTGWRVISIEGLGEFAVRCLRHVHQLTLVEIPDQRVFRPRELGPLFESALP